jgi:hypothetical protein
VAAFYFFGSFAVFIDHQHLITGMLTPRGTNSSWSVTHRGSQVVCACSMLFIFARTRVRCDCHFAATNIFRLSLCLLLQL